MNKILFLNIAKGIGIILIVWAHSHGLFGTQCILLGVPLFFMISGYLHNSNNSFHEFFQKKFLRLYLPFIMCNLFLPSLILIKRAMIGLEIKQNIIYLLKILLTIKKDGFLFGATWFLGSLFIISVLIKLIEITLKSKRKYLYVSLFLILSVILSEILNIPMEIRRTVIGASFYLTGLIINKNIEKLKNIKINYFIKIAFFAILLIFWGYLSKFNYNKQAFLNLIIFYLCSFGFSYLILSFSYFIEKKYFSICGKILEYIGSYSFHILIWHFVFIEIVTAFILIINDIPVNIIESLPHVICESAFCISIYFISGILGPLIISRFYKNIHKKIKINNT